MAALESPPDPPQLSDVTASRLVIGPWDPPRLSDVTPLGTDNQVGLPDVGPRVVIGRGQGCYRTRTLWDLHFSLSGLRLSDGEGGGPITNVGSTDNQHGTLQRVQPARPTR